MKGEMPGPSARTACICRGCVQMSVASHPAEPDASGRVTRVEPSDSLREAPAGQACRSHRNAFHPDHVIFDNCNSTGSLSGHEESHESPSNGRGIPCVLSACGIKKGRQPFSLSRKRHRRRKMSTALLALFAVILCILFRILNVNSAPQRPFLVCKDQSFLTTVLKIAPVIAEPYKPTRLWGFSGHVQTIVHSIVGRVRCPWPIGERVYIGLPDGTTLTYDLYQPLTNGHEDDITIAICPGIGNSSESVYIRTFVHFVQCHGYRCAVLNHVGALSSVKITAPRIFSYGHTDDYNTMLQHLVEQHPNTRIVCIGYSLGGNLVTKYLGERGSNKLPNIIGGISICQGYNALKGTKILLNWQNFRRFYLYVMTESMKNLILKHKNMLLSEDVKQRCNLNERDIISAATLPELDEAYTRRVHNFRSVQELYKWSSCLFYLDNITTPMVFINALDDPIVPEVLLNPIKEHAASRLNTLYVELAHGGHLGFYEGGLLYPNPITWLDRTLVSLVGSLTLAHADKALKAS